MSGSGRAVIAALAAGLVLAAGPAASGHVRVRPQPSRARPRPVVRMSEATARLAAWVSASGDNDGRPYVIVDKLTADAFAFDAAGRLLGSAPVLVGLARGDGSAPGVGQLRLSAIRPDERTTPAGRFVASFGPARGDRMALWVDYADGVALHPVVTANPREHRLARIRSPLPRAHRITYGCINVPAAFYRNVVLKAFGDVGGIVYVLPDTTPLDEVFPGLAGGVAAAGGEGGR